MPRRPYKPVEKQYRAYVRTLGELSPRQAALASQVYTLARAVDDCVGFETPAGSLAAVSRELRLSAEALREDRIGANPAAPVPAEGGDIVDEVARRRAERMDRQAKALAAREGGV